MTDSQSEQLDYDWSGDRTCDLKHGGTLTIPLHHHSSNIFLSSTAVSHLCYGSCNLVSYIGQGLCHVLDIAVGALTLAEAAAGWINAAIQFLMQMFLVH